MGSTKRLFVRVRALLLACALLGSTAAAPAETSPADRPTSPPVSTLGSSPWLAPSWYGRVELDASRAPSLGLRLRHSGDGASTRRASRASAPAPALSVSPGKLALSLPARPTGLHLDLRFALGGGAPLAGGTDAVAAAVLERVRQAYATVKLFNLLTVDLGKFVNAAGPGVIESTSDWLGSRAERLAGAAGQAGLRFALPVGEVTLRGSVLASQAWKTFNLSATVLKPSSGTSVFVDLSGGPSVYSDLRLLLDVVVSQVLRGDRSVADSIRLVGHVEYFAEGLAPGLGTTRVPVDFITATVGAGLRFAGAAKVELRPELRRDQALGGFPAYHGGATDSRTTVQLAVIARF